jgi:hypothetical protein
MNFANQRISAKSAISTLVLSIMLVTSTAIALDASNTSDSGYILCVNKKTKAVTYPATLKCASSESKLLIASQKQGVLASQTSTGGAQNQSIESIVAAILPKVEGATYAVECDGNVLTATGINITLSTDAKKKGYKGAVITSESGLDNCLNKSIPVVQSDKNYGGYVWRIDEENHLALIMTIAAVNYLSPALVAPARGAFLMTYLRGGNLPDGSVGVGTLANINPEFDEEIANISIGGNSRDLAAPIVDKNGDFISVAFRKPGVFCRNLISCPTGSDYLICSN